MPSTYTVNLGIEKPATGEQAGVWGITANTSYDSLDTATDGNLQIALSATSYQLNTAQGAASEGRNKVILWAGALTQITTVNITPNTAKKLYVMRNVTSGGFGVTFQQGTGTSFTLQPGYDAIIYADGAGATASVNTAYYNPQFGNVLVTGNQLVQGSLTFSVPQTFTQSMTFNGALTMNGGASITNLQLPAAGSLTNDLFYRSAAGPLVALHMGSAGQVLTATAGGLAWTTIALAVGSTVSGSIPNGIYFSNASNTLAQDSKILAQANVGIGLGLVPTHTLHLGNGFQPEIWLDTNNPAGQQRQIYWATNGTARWALYSPQAAESGGNANSDLSLISYNDAGSATSQILSFIRASSNVAVGAWGDYGARLAVLASNPNQPVVMVRGAAGQGLLQVWQNSSGGTVASIDGTGHLTVAGGGYLSLTAAGRLDLNGVAPGHPLGTIHVGIEPGTGLGSVLRGSIAMEGAQYPLDAIPNNVIRLYYRAAPSGGYFIIQFYYNGTQYYAALGLQGQQGPAQWNIGSSPPW